MTTVNAALSVPAAILTWLGAMRVELLLDTLISTPPAGAAATRLTVQLTVPPPTKLAGLQISEARTGCVT